MESLKRTPVIIDTDPGVDDVIALLLALASPELEILAITITFGNTDERACFLNVLKLFHAVERHLQAFPDEKNRFPNFSGDRKPILAIGASGPLNGELHTAEYFHGRDGLGDISERHVDLDVEWLDGTSEHPQLALTNQPAAEVAVKLVNSHPANTVCYIALGPLTNLASSLRLGGPAFRDRIGRVICMGGALDVPGNTTPVAEFNFYADPFAVKELLCSAKADIGLALDRFLLVPLDVTTTHELPFPVYAKKVDQEFTNSTRPSRASKKSPIVHFTSSFLERTREVMIGFGKDAMELHDIVAIWCAIENPPQSEISSEVSPTLESGWGAVLRKFEIERTGEITRGMLVIDRRSDEGVFEVGADRTQAELNPNYTPAVAIQTKEQLTLPSRGILCVKRTPGPRALLSVLLERVWNVRL